MEVDEGTMLENVETGIPSTGVYNVLIRYESQVRYKALHRDPIHWGLQYSVPRVRCMV